MSISHHEDSGDCDLRVYQQVAIVGEVTLKPYVGCGEPRVRCLETRVVSNKGEHGCKKTRHHHRNHTCKLLVHQVLCVEVPVQFGVEAVCELERVVCGPASTGPCPSLPLPPGSDEEGSSGSEGLSGTSDYSQGEVIIIDSTGDCDGSDTSDDDR